MEQPFTPEQVELLLYEAGRALMAQHVHGCWPSGYRSGMPEILPQAIRDEFGDRYIDNDEPKPDQPNTAEMTQADMVEGWILSLPANTPVEIRRRKVLLEGMRQVDPITGEPRHAWRPLGQKHGLTAEEAQEVWKRGVARVTAEANRAASAIKVSTVARIRAASLRPMPAPCAETLRRIRAATVRQKAFELQDA